MWNSARTVAMMTCLAGALVPLAGCGREPTAAETVRPVISILVGDAEEIAGKRYPGQASATQEVDMAFEVPGRIIERPVDVGSEVRRGDLLARLDPRDYEADLARARANEAKAESDYRRAESLYADDAISAAALDVARRQLDVSRADIRKAEKAMEETRLVAPFEGTIAATYLENFQNVRAKQPVLRLLDLDRIEMVIDLPEHSIGTVPYVRAVKVRFDVFPDREIDADIKEVGSEASPTTRTYPVTLIMDPPGDLDIKPGMAGEARAAVEFPDDMTESGIEVPVAALFSNPEGSAEKSFVWVIDEGSLTVSAREVETGGPGSRGVMVRGLQAGERIAVAGVNSLREGMKVRLSEN